MIVRSIDLRRVNICSYIDEEKSSRDRHPQHYITVVNLIPLGEVCGYRCLRCKPCR